MTHHLFHEPVSTSALFRWAIVFVCAFCLFAGARVNADVIDSYSAVEGGNADSVSQSGVGNVTTDFTISPTVSDPVGSRRRLSVTQNSASQSASLTVDGGVATLSSSASATSEWSIIYGIGSSGLHYDATDGGIANAFRLTSDSVSNSLEYAIGAFGYTFTGTSNNGTFQPLSSSAVVPFSLFSNGNLIDFSDLNQIQVRIRDGGLSHGGTATLTLFETVPEPAGGTLLAIAAFTVVGVAILRRRLAGRHV